ncbi:hypothetical protein [Nonomuraea harbinensis]|uniref:Phosphoadenosine phosphosulfate reductase n=1 Tax=Nonomuraea harbinensis TaxID=1286938 RepID=A0ABW1C8B2_9ACTN|nr:hypothetical protein [Nonomuraea harbinensis]
MMRHVVQFSGGIGSWAAAQRVAAEHGTDRLTLLFADTLVEDDDLYRFNRDATAQLGVDLTVVCDGRTPFEVFADVRFLGNARIAPCSYWLKQKPCRDWLTAHADLRTTIVYVGIDWSEKRRIPGIQRGWAPWGVRFPMVEPPSGQRQWLHHLRTHPDRFLRAEHEESRLRAELGDVAILKRRRHGVTRPLPLAELRRHAQAA